MTPDTLEPTLDAMQVFVNSPHSVRVFETLTDGATTSRTLVEQTGASRSTVARILDEGESRGWIDSEGSQYKLTHLGEVMIEEFRAYRQTIEGVQRLGDAIYWLPPPAQSLDFCHFRDVDIITAVPTNPAKPFDYVAELLLAATKKRSLATTAVPRFAELAYNQSEAGELDSELVIEASWFDALDENPGQVPLWRARAERDGVWVYEGEVPVNLELYDDTVVIWLGEEQEKEEELVVRGVLVTEVPDVVSWAASLYEDYRAEAVPLDPAMLPEV